jgi:CII-binding regulator of phage lambda lysogenization HflD
MGDADAHVKTCLKCTTQVLEETSKKLDKHESATMEYRRKIDEAEKLVERFEDVESTLHATESMLARQRVIKAQMASRYNDTVSMHATVVAGLEARITDTLQEVETCNAAYLKVKKRFSSYKKRSTLKRKRVVDMDEEHTLPAAQRLSQ